MSARRAIGEVTYQFENATSIVPVVTGYATYRVVGIVAQPPALTDQFDQVNGAVLPPAATAAALAHYPDLVPISEQAQELKAPAPRPARWQGGRRSDVHAKIAEMPEPDGAMAGRLHAIINASAPDFSPRTWYGMPA
jgi:hypothetical protein